MKGYVAAALALLWLLVPPASAQGLPRVDPVGTTYHDHVLAYDRSSLPSGISLFAQRTVLGYDIDLDRGYGRIHLTCRSDADSRQGRCPVADTGLNGAGRSTVTLRFVERRSGLRTDLQVVGALQRAYGDRRCFTDYWESTERPLSTSYSPACIGTPPAGTGVQLELPQHELEKLVAGRWEAELTLDVRVDSNGAAPASHVFAFDLTVTDHNAVAIYFPAFDQVTPLVGLNLRYDPIRQTVAGRAVLDMCLYDGVGSQSQYIGVTVRDPVARGAGPGGYAAWHQDGGVDDSQRLDYTVVLEHAGARLPMANGVEQLLRGIDSAQLRLVMLPGMAYPVYCVPTPLELVTPSVPASSKRPGYFSGDLQVEMRLPSSVP